MARQLPDWFGLKLGILWAAHRLRVPALWLHRAMLHGMIGRGFQIGRGSCLIARNVKVGARVSIGRHSTVVAESIEIGDDVVIGANVTIRCRTVRLGSKSRIDARNTIYGILTPHSGFELGRHAWIYPDCHINTDHYVRIGDRSAAGSYTLIFSHSSYLPITHGYPVSIQPVEIGSDVWLPWHVFVLPGAKIGNGSTVGAFSLVAGEIPANSLAVGVPARVVKDADHYRRKYNGGEMIALVNRVVDEAVNFTIGAFKPNRIFFLRRRALEQKVGGMWVLRDGSLTATIVFVQGYAGPQSEMGADLDRTLYVSIGGVTDLPPGASWIDPVSLRSSISPTLSSLLHEVISALSAFGLRFGWMSEAEIRLDSDQRAEG